ncbi:MAG TPA: hypothetical protein VFH56_08320 [Acidimicrobiales bacterium]|nr:hypothetical protein [Acidimicrobiales bacterium]
MTEPTPNLPLLRKVLDHIDAHPEQWYQAEIAHGCGTAFCVAGWAVQFAGHELTVDGWNDDALDGDHTASVCDAASEALGITRGEAQRLYAWNNDREAIQRAAEAIATRAGERL